MKPARILALAFAAALVLPAAPAHAQNPNQPPGVQKPAPPAKSRRTQRPKQKLDRTQQLDGLFAALKQAPNPQIAKAIEARIDATLLETTSDTLTLLMVRARTTVEAKEFDTAIELLDSIIEINPRYTEAYAQRATIYFVKKDFARSLADLRVVLAQEPRHYGALAGLGIILQDIGEDKRALDAYRRALDINPHLENIPDLVRRLKIKVEGREI